MNNVSIITPMTEGEARQVIYAIREGFTNLRYLLLELKERQGWKALGYKNFVECADKEFGYQKTHVYQLLAAAEVERNIFSAIAEKTSNIPETHLRPLTQLNPGEQADVWKRVQETGGELTAVKVARVRDEYLQEKYPLSPPARYDETYFDGMSQLDKEDTLPPLANHQLINQSTSNEWYTPRQYIRGVREVMGDIDIDPASNAYANQIVCARVYYDKESDGFQRNWHGRVFLNPPYGRSEEEKESNQALWSKKLVEQYQLGITTEAILLVNAVPGNRWFAPLWDFTVCFTDHRIRFYNEEKPDGGQPTHSNAFVYMGSKNNLFADVFSRFGVVAVRYESTGDF